MLNYKCFMPIFHYLIGISFLKFEKNIDEFYKLLRFGFPFKFIFSLF